LTQADAKRGIGNRPIVVIFSSLPDIAGERFDLGQRTRPMRPYVKYPK
jgi:hypothetical protein